MDQSHRDFKTRSPVLASRTPCYFLAKCLIFAAQAFGLGCAAYREPATAGTEMLYFFEDFVLDPDRRELRRGNALIEVQPQVFDLLQYLVANRDRVVSKDDIIQAVWGGRIVSEFALTSRINATRTAVGDNGDRQRLIRTLPRKGIRFVGLVQERALPVEEAPVASSVLDAETSGRTAAGWDTPKSAERRQITIASCELLLGAENAGMDPEDIGRDCPKLS